MGGASMDPGRHDRREDLAAEYGKIVAETFFDRNGPMEDCGWAMKTIVEEFEFKGARIRRELLVAGLGNAGHIYFPGEAPSKQLGNMVFEELRLERAALGREGRSPRAHTHVETEGAAMRVTFAEEGTLGRSTVGALAVLEAGCVKLVCVAGLQVAPQTAPNDRHWDQIFSSTHRVYFQTTLTDGMEAGEMLDPRRYRLTEGRPYRTGNLGSLECLLEPLPWEELRVKLERT